MQLKRQLVDRMNVLGGKPSVLGKAAVFPVCRGDFELWLCLPTKVAFESFSNFQLATIHVV